MPEYLAPGVYVEEVDTGPKPIEGVSTSTSGMVGVTEWGPVDIATLVTSVPDFQRQFGGYLNDDDYPSGWYLPHAVEGFFQNGGKRLYIVRVLPDTANFAKTFLFDGTGSVSGILAVPTQANDTGIVLLPEVGVAAKDIWLKVDEGDSGEYVQIDSDGLKARLLTLVGSYAFKHSVGASVEVMGTETVDSTSPNPARKLTTVDVKPGDTFLTLNDRTGLSARDVLRVGAGVQREYVAIDNPAPPLANSVTLRYPIQFPHSGTGNPEPAVKIINFAASAVSSKLAATVSSGEALLLLQNGAGFTANQVVKIAGDIELETEYRTIQEVFTARLRSQDRFAFYHSPGTGIRVVTAVAPSSGVPPQLTSASKKGDKVLSLNNVGGLAAGEILRIGSDSDSNREYVVIQAVGAQNQISLRYALVFEHSNGTAVSEVTTAPVANGGTVIAGSADVNKFLVLLRSFGSPNAFTNNSLVEIDFDKPEEKEYRVINTLPTLTPIYLKATALAYPHAAEVPISAREPKLIVQAIDKGKWGNYLRVNVELEQQPRLTTRTEGATSPGASSVRLSSTVGVEKGTVLVFGDSTGNKLHTQKIVDVSGKEAQFEVGGLTASVPIPPGTQVQSLEFKLTVEYVRVNPLTLQSRITTAETHRYLSLDPRHSRYIVTVIGKIPNGVPLRADGRTEGESSLIRLQDLRSEAEAIAELVPGPDSGKRWLAGGDDSITNLDDGVYVASTKDNVNPQDRKGLYALKNIDEISIVAIPGRTSQYLQEILINHCELMRYRFAVLDSQLNSDMAEIQEQRGLYDSKFAAIYYPWLRIPDPFPENPRISSQIFIPPSGHVIGIYARSDIERGVHKAPANEVIRGISDLEVKLMKEQQDILNPRNINVLRNFREDNRGLRVWGARTLSSDPDWKYINVRRLFIFIEKSIDRGTQWVVFEPNAEPLWQRVKRVVSAFLTNVWRDGALMGQTPEEAFFVKCDRTTMTQYDIDNGRLIALVGIAPVKPAEFVIFRIGQWAGGSEVEEG